MTARHALCALSPNPAAAAKNCDPAEGEDAAVHATGPSRPVGRRKRKAVSEHTCDRFYVTQDGGVIGSLARRGAYALHPGDRPLRTCGNPGGQGGDASSDRSERSRLGPDGWLYFTGPSGPHDPVGRSNPGFLCALRPDGTGILLDELPPTYPNGWSVIWAESHTRAVRRRRGGAITTLYTLPPTVVPDGFKIATMDRRLGFLLLYPRSMKKGSIANT